ncbi:hypothetical protein [Nonomuraea sp. CA-141351]|uniref:hypothetical protein n=1 Tax=Nonomuraea sp. CA-141351 TaxID=3239996 RepID=UPI003D911924
MAELGLAEAKQDTIIAKNLHRALGRAYAGLGATGEAREHLTRAIEAAEKYRWWIPAALDETKADLATLDADHNT